MKKMKIFVNALTFSRIIGSVVMCFFEVLSVPFYIVYTYSGLTDFLDGFLARKFKVTSKFGSNLDSIADLIFFTTMMIKIWPFLCKNLFFSTWIVIWCVLAVRLFLYIFIQLKYHQLISSHQFLNKLTGAMMFLLPFLVKFEIVFRIYSVIVSSVAVASIIFELATLRNTIEKF